MSLRIVRSELTKIITLPSVWIVTGIVLGSHVLIQLQALGLFTDAVSNITPDGIIEIFVDQPEPAETALVGLLVASSLQPGLLLPVIGAVIAGYEFREGHLGMSVLAVPRRIRLVIAKAVATALYALAVALLLAGVSTAFMYVAVKDWNPGILWSPEALAGQGRFLLFAVTFTLTAFAVTLVARRTLTGIIAMVVLIALTMTQLLALLSPGADALLPMSAARNLLLRPDGTLTASPEHGAIVLAAWAAITVVAAAIAVQRRDAR